MATLRYGEIGKGDYAKAFVSVTSTTWMLWQWRATSGGIEEKGRCEGPGIERGFWLRTLITF